MFSRKHMHQKSRNFTQGCLTVAGPAGESGTRLFPRIILLCFALYFFSSCAIKEIPPSVEAPPGPPPLTLSEPPVPRRYKTVLNCSDNTNVFFNRCGIEALPFIRTVFFDMDGDGLQEMIAGNKDGSLRLYRNHGTMTDPAWCVVDRYFDGIAAGAFLVPAVGDIDHDGKPEIVVGTGGFSSDSGRVLFYKNIATSIRPVWEKMTMPEIRVGNDATPALFDADDDGDLDIIVGNSAGRLFLFRNTIKNEMRYFEKDGSYFKGISLGMYAVPAASSYGSRDVIIAGNSLGKLYLLERIGGEKSDWKKSQLHLSVSCFASPTFVGNADQDGKDMVVSDCDGRLYYFGNRDGYRKWEELPLFFTERILPGPVSAPAVTEIDGKSYMVVGNIYGELKLFEYVQSSKGLPWIEKYGVFGDIKLPGFSRGVLTFWEGRHLLITGQQNGLLKAFRNDNNLEASSSWTELKGFFDSIPACMHAAPYVFDIDGDGKWELIVGGAEGDVRGFRYEYGEDGNPVWKEIDEMFKYVRAGRFAAPAVFRNDERLYLLVGQQDGQIKKFMTYMTETGPVFFEDGMLDQVRLRNHSSPSVIEKNGMIELSVGDYDGNLEHYICEKNLVEIRLN